MRALFVLLSLLLAACGGSSSSAPQLPPAPVAPVVNIDVGIKQLVFSWAGVPGAIYYRLLENADGHAGFTQVGADIPDGTLSVTLPVAVHLHDFANALYMVEACNANGCNGSSAVNAMNGTLDAIGYFKASNTEAGDGFGVAVSLSADGRTLAVGAVFEDSGATGINGDQSDNNAAISGAVYIFRVADTNWHQQAYVKASNTEEGDFFGHQVALSADGDTLAVAAIREDSDATGIDGDQSDNSADSSGAVYLFRFDGTDWNQEAYVKASNTQEGDIFGIQIALSEDGDTLAVGAILEDSGATGIDGDQSDNSADSSGAGYLFRFDGTDWYQEAYIKASNTGGGNGNPDPEDNEPGDRFGSGLALSEDGNKLAVGSSGEDSGATGIGGDQNNDSHIDSGAAYFFRFDGTDWNQEIYLKASNTEVGDGFGTSLALSADGRTLVIGAGGEDSSATGIGGDQNDNSAPHAGAMYVFRSDGTDWIQETYLKASNTEHGDGFSLAALSGDGKTLAVAAGEDSNATGINGDENDNSAPHAGAVYVFRSDGPTWLQQAYVKASNTDTQDFFGSALALSGDGDTLVIGAHREYSGATGIGGDQTDDSAELAGSVYMY